MYNELMAPFCNSEIFKSSLIGLIILAVLGILGFLFLRKWKYRVKKARKKPYKIDDHMGLN